MARKRTPRTEYMMRLHHARRAAFFDGKACVECGSTERLEADHIDPKTKHPDLRWRGARRNLWLWPEARLKAELAKCQVLCRPCHVIKSARELGYEVARHGWWRYKQGCRCDVCKAANAEHARRVRANRKARQSKRDQE